MIPEGVTVHGPGRQKFKPGQELPASLSKLKPVVEKSAASFKERNSNGKSAQAKADKQRLENAKARNAKLKADQAKILAAKNPKEEKAAEIQEPAASGNEQSKPAPGGNGK
jgi:hypothetical protein